MDNRMDNIGINVISTWNELSDNRRCDDDTFKKESDKKIERVRWRNRWKANHFACKLSMPLNRSVDDRTKQILLHSWLVLWWQRRRKRHKKSPKVVSRREEWESKTLKTVIDEVNGSSDEAAIESTETTIFNYLTRKFLFCASRSTTIPNWNEIMKFSFRMMQ